MSFKEPPRRIFCFELRLVGDLLSNLFCSKSTGESSALDNRPPGRLNYDLVPIGPLYRIDDALFEGLRMLLVLFNTT